ncbi:ATP-binding protein [Paenibacillus puldeungensis]|uniref:histidine kinase n=1 Tax=Paenibacillus puldeungensis TaxID=696536 RepID=A0ABW3S433_9BACL
MTIKTKLALTITCLALITVSLNISLSYLTTRDNLRKDSEANMLLTAKHIALTVEQSRSVYNYVKSPLGKTMDHGVTEDIMEMTSPERITRESMSTNNSLLEITGIDPRDFDTNNILFGSYRYKNDPMVEEASREALRKGISLLKDTRIGGQRVLESYVPIMSDAEHPYVIRIISSYKPISSAISKQVLSQFAVSFFLMIIMGVASYVVAGRLIHPIHNILGHVSQLASGRFDTRLRVDRKDEFGLLANKINAMADSLGSYTAELKCKSEENRSVKEYLESIINQTADAIHITDMEGKVLKVNSAFEILYGWSRKEIVGTSLDFVPSFADENGPKWHQEAELLGKAVPVLIETQRMRKDGSRVDVSISVSPIFNQDGKITALISISRDMTEHNRVEELLRRSEKLTTVGQLAAGVAHEIRNPLTTLRGFLQMQQRSQKVNTMHTDVMLAELDRINLIVSEFLILAKPQAVQYQTKDIRFTLGDVISFLDSEAHLRSVEFALFFPEAPVLVHCEENQLKQVFINILKNAMEAMPKGGIVTLRLETDQVGKQAILRIVDEGEGIAKERLHKLGEPFYTNKEKGTGLGLMVSQRIIEGHRGTLAIESELGLGTTVTIRLPIGNLAEAAKSDHIAG